MVCWHWFELLTLILPSHRALLNISSLKDESGKNTINLTELEQSLSPDTKINTIGVVELDTWN